MPNEIQHYKKMQEIARKADNDPFLKDILNSMAETDRLTQNASRNEDSYAIFAFDTTGSMHHCIEEVRTNLATVVDNLVRKDGVNIMVAGVGEYCDEPYTLQIRDFTDDPKTLKENIDSIKNTPGGGPMQVSLELFWQELNKQYVREGNKYVMVVVSDEIAHGQNNAMSNPRADYKKELSRLRPYLSGFYFVSCTDYERVIELQKQLVGKESRTFKHIYLKDMMALGEILPDLLVYVTKASTSEHAADDFLRQLARSTNESERKKALKISELLALPPPKP